MPIALQPLMSAYVEILSGGPSGEHDSGAGRLIGLLIRRLYIRDAVRLFLELQTGPKSGPKITQRHKGEHADVG